MEDNKAAHLGFIQGVINRMGNNSFLLKGWSVSLVVALFALSASGSDKTFIHIAFFPVLVFWVLDAFFLYQEKLFIELYREVAEGGISSDKFTLSTSAVKPKTPSMIKLAFTNSSLIVFHGIILAAVLFAMCYVKG